MLTEGGRVIGISTWEIKPDKAESLGFAVSIVDVRRVFASFLQ